jgi:hypothetical protein
MPVRKVDMNGENKLKNADAINLAIAQNKPYEVERPA